jgi:hypothetical protein
MLIKITTLLLLFFVCPPLLSQTIRPSHWINDDLRYYWHRNALWELSPLTRPFNAQEILTALDSLPIARNEPGRKLLRQMPAQSDTERALGWIVFDNAFRHDQHIEDWHAVQRATLGAQLHPNVGLFGSFYVDNQLDADTSYIGKRQSGVAAFMEQAYITLQHKKFSAKFGRDYLVWGPGVDATLHLSDASRPIDHLFLSWKNRWIALSYFTGSLDRTEYPVDDEESVQNRYLSGHRLELRPWPFVRVGLTETALFGGPDIGNDFALLNPVLFYTGIQFNGPQTANVLGSLDAAVMPLRNIMLYGSFMFDDFQFENDTNEDQEPAQIGFMAGFNWADPLLRGLDLFGEYTRVTNRTYSGQGGMWEKYLHRNVPLGHFLGNDFDRFLVGVRYRPQPGWRFETIYEQRRRGQGRITDKFTTPWRDLLPGQTFNEPFPTGIVEYGDNFRVTARWQPLLWLYSDFFLSYWTVENRENQQGVNKNYWEFRLNVSVEFLGTTSLQ